MRFLFGCDVNREFRRYLRKIVFYKEEENLRKLEALVNARLLNLIVWSENNEIIGHAIWHESTIDEHRKGDAKDKEDREILERLLGKEMFR